MGITFKNKRKLKRSHWELTAMLAPGIIFAFIFSYLPMAGLIVAFKDYKFNLGIFDSAWVGMKNFEFLFASQTLYILIRNTLGYGLIFIALGVVVGILLALMIDTVKSKIAVKVFQSSMFLPYFLSWIIVSYVSHALLQYDTGIINSMLEMFGHGKISFYSKSEYWPGILTTFNVWKGMGFNALIYYGTILSINTELFEAATIDGCSYIQRVRYIVLPHLNKTVIILTILALGSIFRSDYGMFLYLTKDSGALYKATDVLDTYILRSLRESGSVGASSAIGFLQSVVGFLLVVFANWCVNRIDSDSAIF